MLWKVGYIKNAAMSGLSPSNLARYIINTTNLRQRQELFKIWQSFMWYKNQIIATDFTIKIKFTLPKSLYQCYACMDCIQSESFLFAHLLSSSPLFSYTWYSIVFWQSWKPKIALFRNIRYNRVPFLSNNERKTVKLFATNTREKINCLISSLCNFY